MPIEQRTCYVVRCDMCGTDGGEEFIPHFRTAADARGWDDDGWMWWKDHVWCEGCVPACACGHWFGGHEYGEAACEDCDCTGFALPEAAS